MADGLTGRYSTRMLIFAAWSDQTGPVLVGMVLGAALVAAAMAFSRHWKRRHSVSDLLQKHFGRTSGNDIEVHTREFPYRACVDAYQSVLKWLDANCQVKALVGVPISGGFMESTGITNLMFPTEENHKPCALEYDAFDVGEDEPLQCVKHALWLMQSGPDKLALLWTSTTTHSCDGFQTKLRLDLAYLRSDTVAAKREYFFRQIELGIQKAKTYRGKVLSLESGDDYRGTSGGVRVHRLRAVSREDVILPESTVRLLERNVVRFVEQRPELAKLGMPVKKGLLFYGPPGTGKTHTLHYLFGALPGHTVLLVTGEQVGMLGDYIALARLLQPSVVVLEDADLVGRERRGISIGREALLSRLLNEMDGLRADAEILFLLTTNRPEALEKALAARPGRIDQAIEFPLPDDVGRKKLIRLYAAGAHITDEVVQQTVRATEGVSASFIKELMRRAIQFHLECRSGDGELCILQNDVDQAIDELLYIGGSLNRTLLGADSADLDTDE